MARVCTIAPTILNNACTHNKITHAFKCDYSSNSESIYCFTLCDNRLCMKLVCSGDQV